MTRRSTFNFGWFLTMLALMLEPVKSLQLHCPFARHFFDSSATAVDRDIGSGDFSSNTTSCDGWHTFGHPALSVLTVNNEVFLDLGTIRYGEAEHPGPPPGDLLTVGVSNPGGLRRKEQILL